jgi:hypothetical protein
MELLWNDLPEEIQSKLESALLATLGDFNDSRFSSLLLSCVKLGYDWPNQTGIKEVVFSTFVRLFQREKEFGLEPFLYSIRSFGQSGVKWAELPSDVKMTILQGSVKMSPLLHSKLFGEVLSG